MRVRIALLALVLLLVLPFSADADPGSGDWLNESGGLTSFVFENETARYTFSTITNSKVIQVFPALADVCLISKDGGGSLDGLGRATMYRVIRSDSPLTNDAILMPAIPSNGADCIIIVAGKYWVEVDAIDTPSSTVTITGRVN